MDTPAGNSLACILIIWANDEATEPDASYLAVLLEQTNRWTGNFLMNGSDYWLLIIAIRIDLMKYCYADLTFLIEITIMLFQLSILKMNF